jgi:hypothetical protein
MRKTERPRLRPEARETIHNLRATQALQPAGPGWRGFFAYQTGLEIYCEKGLTDAVYTVYSVY